MVTKTDDPSQAVARRAWGALLEDAYAAMGDPPEGRVLVGGEEAQNLLVVGRRHGRRRARPGVDGPTSVLAADQPPPVEDTGRPEATS